MSFDIKLQNNCDHRINWLKSEIETDRKSLSPSYPVSSVTSLRIRINNVTQPLDSYVVVTSRQKLSLILVTKIEFYTKIKHYDPIVELNYTTFPEVCPKCLGLKTIDDLTFNGNGDIQVIYKQNLLLQQVEKVIVTKISTNTFHVWYGTDLHNLIGTKISDRDLLYTNIREQIGSAIDKLKAVQNQMLASGRKFDPEELFGKLLKIEIEETGDPSLILVNVYFTSQSNTPIEYSQYLNLEARQRVVM